MTKNEIVAYLANLDTLMKAQGAAGNVVSAGLATEYTKHWDLFKSTLKEEHDKDEARKSHLKRGGGNEARTDLSSNRRGSSEPDRSTPVGDEYESAHREGTGIVRPGS